MFVNHLIAKPGEKLPPIGNCLYEYVLGADGIFVRAQRPEFEVMLCATEAKAKVAGLAEIKSHFLFHLPCVPVELVERIYIKSLAEMPMEILFHLLWDGDRWELVVPEQTQSPSRCKPVEDGPDSSYAKAVIEVHSHGTGPSYFSGTDDLEEKGFRIYGVIGSLKTSPHLNVRVGVYGNYYHIPAEWVFDLPERIKG